MGKGGRKAFIRGFWAERNAEAEWDRESEKNGFEKYNKPVLSRSTDLSHVISIFTIKLPLVTQGMVLV